MIKKVEDGGAGDGSEEYSQASNEYARKPGHGEMRNDMTHVIDVVKRSETSRLVLIEDSAEGENKRMKLTECRIENEQSLRGDDRSLALRRIALEDRRR